MCLIEQVNTAMDVAMKFFLQPDAVKKTFSRETFSVSPNHGWVSVETER